MCSSNGRAPSVVPLLAMLAVSFGCSTNATVRVSPYVPGQSDGPNGAVYQLPRALLQTDFALKLTLRPAPGCAESAADCTHLVLAAGDATIAQPQLSTVSIPDPAATFVIRSPGSFMVKTSFDAQFSPTGELTSAKAASSDQTIEFAAWGLESVGTIAKAVAAAGETPEATRRHQKARQRAALEQALAKLDDRLVELANDEASGTHSVRDTAEAARSAASPHTQIEHIMDIKAKLRTAIAAIDAELVRSMNVPITCALDPSSKNSFIISESGGDCPAYVAARAALTAAEVDVQSPLPELTVTLSEMGSKPPAPAPAKASSHSLGTHCADARAPEICGFVYRIPAWFRAEVASEHQSQVQKMIAIPQRGKLAVFGLQDQDLRLGKTVAVSLHPSLGTLNEVKLNGEPVKLDDARKVVGAASAAITLGNDLELARWQREAALAEAQKNYLQNVADLEKARKKAETAQAPQ